MPTIEVKNAARRPIRSSVILPSIFPISKFQRPIDIPIKVPNTPTVVNKFGILLRKRVLLFSILKKLF